MESGVKTGIGEIWLVVEESAREKMMVGRG